MPITKPVWGPGPERVLNDKLNQMVEYLLQEIAATSGSATFNESVDDRVAALLQVGFGLSKTYDDTGNTLTIARHNPSRTITASTTLLATDETIFINASSGPVTLTLLPAATGRPIWVARTDNVNANTVTIQAAGSDTIGASSSKSLVAQFEGYNFRPNGSNLWVAF
jgi:outer membrane protein assembly factor BamB